MLAAGAEYQEYEALVTGAAPAVRASILPYFWPTGVNADGSFTSCIYVGPDRIQADYEGFTGGEWISPVLTANLQVPTSPAVVTWDYNTPGFDSLLYYRGANDTTALAASAWTLVNQGDTIQIFPFYQFKLTLEGYRAWAEDSSTGDRELNLTLFVALVNESTDLDNFDWDFEQDFDLDQFIELINALPESILEWDLPLDVLGDDFTAWAVDTAGVEAEEGYASDANVPGDSLTYIEALALLGQFTVVQDIEWAGSVSLEAPKDFSDLVAGSHSGLLLNNRQKDGAGLPAPRYSPDKSSFLFADEDDWYGKQLKMELGWRRRASWGTTGFWKFLENLLDSSGEGHELTWQGGGSPAYTTGLLPGTTAVVLDGAHYASAANHADFNPGTGTLSIEVVVEFDELPASNGVLVGKRDATSKGYLFYWGVDCIRVALIEDLISKYYSGYFVSPAMQTGVKYYFVVTWDSSDDLRVYLNGSPIALTYDQGSKQSLNLDTTTPFCVGGLNTGSSEVYQLDGKIDLVRFHKGRALTAAEIAANYAGFLVGMPYEVGLSSDYTEFLTLFLGKITKWGPVTRALESPNNVEIYAKDFITDCLQKRICLPAADGSPAPLTFGEFLCQGEAISGWSPAPLIRSAYFEANDYSELDGTVESGGGAVSLITPGLTGTRAFRAATTGANQAAYGLFHIDNNSEIFVTGNMRFSAIPGAIVDYNLTIFQIIGSTNFNIFVDHTGAIYGSQGGQTKFNILAYQDVPLPFAMWLAPTNPGYAKFWINGEEVINASRGNFSGFLPTEFRFGAQTGATAETWTLDFDDIEIRYKYYNEAFQVSGGPFTEIGPVYVNNIAQPDSQVIGAYTQTLTRFPQYGLVTIASNDPEFKPPSDVLIRVVENAGGRHALYIIEALLAAAGVTAYVDATALAAAYAAVPDDIIHARFEGGEADKQGLKDFASLGLPIADALKEVCSRCLYWIFVDAGVIKIVPYLGTPPSGPVLALTGSNMREAGQIIDMDSLNAFVTGIYGWYARNSSLFYTAGDTTAGGQGTGLDFSWDGPVACESLPVVKAKVDLLLKFLSAQDRVDPVSLNLAGARLELMDPVSLADDLLNDAAQNYWITRKEVNLDPGSQGTSLQLMRFLGE